MSAPVSSQRSLTAEFKDHLEKAPPNQRSSATTIHDAPQRKAIFAVHGVSPHQRYAFQDQVALSLRSYLNARELLSKSSITWKAVIHWPTLAQPSDSKSLRPSALRIYRSDDHPANPAHTVYDVYEGYWSPLSKGKTNIASAAQWLLNATFLGTSSTANIPCDFKKLRWDFAYIGLMLSFVVTFALLSVGAAFVGWMWFVKAIVTPDQKDFEILNFLSHPFASAMKLPPRGYLELALTVIAAYLLAQLVTIHTVSKARRRRTYELQNDAAKTASTFRDDTIRVTHFRRWASAILWVAFLITAIFAVIVPIYAQHLSWTYPVGAALLTAAVCAFQAARSTADFAVENVLGDVQVYTTHDNNSTYYAIRREIVQAVSDALTGVMVASDPDTGTPFYGSIHIFGHSLGSTIAMDALIQVRQMIEENTLKNAGWERILSFTTFGTALEKTKFFFDVRQPTISAAQDQWANDVYGRFFTDKISVLSQRQNTNGIYWNNLWYSRDIVANEIVSYQSDVPAGSPFIYLSANRAICDNHHLTHTPAPLWAWVHSDYLGDKNFWEIVGPVIA